MVAKFPHPRHDNPCRRWLSCINKWSQTRYRGEICICLERVPIYAFAVVFLAAVSLAVVKVGIPVHIGTEAMAIIQTFIQLKMELKRPIPIFEDNQACINIMTISNNASSSRHIKAH